MFTDTGTSICLNAISGMTLTPVTTSGFVVMIDLLAQPVLARRGSARHWLLQAGAAAQLAAAVSARAPREFMTQSQWRSQRKICPGRGLPASLPRQAQNGSLCKVVTARGPRVLRRLAISCYTARCPPAVRARAGLLGIRPPATRKFLPISRSCRRRESSAWSITKKTRRASASRAS
jgi:hypothetical protein